MLTFFFRVEIPFLVKIDPKSQNCYFKLKLKYLDYFEYAEFNSDVHIFCFRLEIPLLSTFDPKSKNCYLKLKLCIETNLNIRNSVFMLTFLF